MMQKRESFIIGVSVALLLGVSGCATDRAVFATKTSLAILDVDSAPSSVSIAYDRKEGFVGPAYNGVAPPAIAVIKSGVGIFKPKIKQLYATGNAAVLASNQEASITTEEMRGDGSVMFFGTTTNVGLKLSVEPTSSGIPVPNNFVFGFRRKEFSVIPIQETTDGSKVYPSVLATIDTNAEAKVGTDGKEINFSNVQYFATGIAAQNVAIQQRDVFMEQASEAFDQYRAEKSKQRKLAGSILTCFEGVGIENKLAVLDDANRLELLSQDLRDNFVAVRAMFKDDSIVKGSIINNPNLLAKVYREYAQSIYTDADGFDVARFKLMQIHEKKVCEMSRQNG